jgi:hypothetical protein
MAAMVDDDFLTAVKAGVEAKGKKWKDSKWEGLVQEVVQWLLGEEEDTDDVVAAAVGLIVYGVTTEKKLQAVAGSSPDDEKLARKLSAEGISNAICDALFDKYVAKSGGKKRARTPSGCAWSPCRRVTWTSSFTS